MKLKAIGIQKSYGLINVVNGVDIELNQGEIVGLLGPNGAGKTTCFYTIVGLIKPNSGKIQIDSQDISKKAMYDLAWLMGVAADKLESVLTKRLVKVRMEETSVPLNQESAKDSVDALAKQIYDRVFLWLVRRINEATSARTLNEEDFGIIGLLDIFGFESFTVNSFEQLCINFCNENLQQFFVFFAHTRNIF